MIAREVLEAATRLAKNAGAEATPWDARVLLAHASGGSNPLALNLRDELDPAAQARFEELWEKRLAGVPVQHLVGEWDFFGRPFFVDERGLIPRPETETLISVALREAPEARRVLDAGTGSGILALTFLQERPHARVIALDASTPALALARANAKRHGLLERLELVCSDWLSALGSVTFDLALSNPPYLALSEERNLPETVRDHEPRMALFGGAYGLDAICHLLDDLPRVLEPNAHFLFEIGFGQAAAVELEIRRRPQWQFDWIEPDLAGIPRVAIARRTPR